jgi:NhaP-type Na+/H+ and K+/H+ antiporter
MIKVSGEYRGYTIEWVEYNRYFDIKLDDVVATHKDTLDECAKWIDVKLKENFKRIPVIINNWQSWKFGEATSIQDGDDVWVVCSGRRSKESIRNVYADNEKNRLAIKTLEELNKQKLETLEKMETLKPEMMVINAGDTNG